MNPKPISPKVWVARRTGVVEIKGITHRYYEGRTVPADSPLLKAVPSQFELVDLDRAGVVIGHEIAEPPVHA